MLLSAVPLLVVAQSISEIPEGLMNNPVHSGKNSHLAGLYARFSSAFKETGVSPRPKFLRFVLTHTCVYECKFNESRHLGLPLSTDTRRVMVRMERVNKMNVSSFVSVVQKW